MVNAVLSRNLASMSRCASEKCQNETGEVHALSEPDCMSVVDISSELPIVVAMMVDIETGEKGVKRDFGQIVVFVGAPNSITCSVGPSCTWNDP
jgi:hypothetical protein